MRNQVKCENAECEFGRIVIRKYYIGRQTTESYACPDCKGSGVSASKIKAELAVQEKELVECREIFNRKFASSSVLDYTYNRQNWAKDKVADLKKLLSKVEG